MLFQPEQSDLLSEVHGWPEFGSLKAHTDQFEKKLKEIELAKDALAKREKAIKSEFARGLAHGFK